MRYNCTKILTQIFAVIITISILPAVRAGELEDVYKKYNTAVSNLDIEQFKKSVAAETIKKIEATPAGQILLTWNQTFRLPEFY